MIETIELAAGVTLLAVQTEKFKSGCFSFNLMRPHTGRRPARCSAAECAAARLGALAGYARHLDAP